MRRPAVLGGLGPSPADPGALPTHARTYIRPRSCSRGGDTSSYSLGGFVWISGLRDSLRRVVGRRLARCAPTLPAGRGGIRALAELLLGFPGRSGGSGHRFDGGFAGPADRVAVRARSGRRHEAPAVLLPRPGGAGLRPRLQAAGHPHR